MSAANYGCGTSATESGRDPSEATAAFAERERARAGIEGSNARRDSGRAKGKKAAEQVSPKRGDIVRPEYTMEQIPLLAVSALGHRVQRTGIVHCAILGSQPLDSDTYELLIRLAGVLHSADMSLEASTFFVTTKTSRDQHAGSATQPTYMPEFASKVARCCVIAVRGLARDGADGDK